MQNPRPDPEAWRKIAKAVDRLDFAISLCRAPWEFFATYTVRGHPPRASVLYGLAMATLQDSCKMLGIERHTLFSALRFELGELGERPHFHCLLGHTGTKNRITDQHRLGRVWRIVSGGGRDDIRLYNRLRNGPDYLAESLGAKNQYEIGKYSLAESTTLSDSVTRYLTYLDRMTLRLNRKDEQGG